MKNTEFRTELKKMLDKEDNKIISLVLEFALEEYPISLMNWIHERIEIYNEFTR